MTTRFVRASVRIVSALRSLPIGSFVLSLSRTRASVSGWPTCCALVAARASGVASAGSVAPRKPVSTFVSRNWTDASDS